MSEQVTALPEATPQSVPEAPSAARRRRRLAEQVRAVALGVGFPFVLILLWDRAVAITGTRLVPSPREVAVMMYDFSFGGVYDDAFSATILTHIWKSMTRVYGGFFLAALIGIPLGLMIGRIKLLRQLLDPTINLLRPIPVTAWLPLSMIFFGLGPNAAIFLVFLGAFYPILLNTIFGVRSVDVRLFEAAAMLGCSGSAMFRQIVFPASLPSIFNGLRIAHGFAWILIVVGEMTGVPTGLGSVVDRISTSILRSAKTSGEIPGDLVHGKTCARRLRDSQVQEHPR